MISTGGTTTLGLYDNASEISKKANIADVYAKYQTYSRSEVDTVVGSAVVGSAVVGRKAYQTLAQAQADQSNLQVNTSVEVTNDGTNNGTYQWNGTVLTKSSYDPLYQAKAYTDQYVLGREVETIHPSALLGASSTASTNTVNLEILGNHVNFTNNAYVGANGEIFPLASTRISDYIPVMPNDTFFITPSLTYIGAVYDKNLQYLGTLTGTEGGTTTVTIGQYNASFVRFNVSVPDITRVYAVVKPTTLSWFYATPNNISDAVGSIINDVVDKNILNGVSFTDGGYIDDNNVVNSFSNYKYTNQFVPVNPSTKYVISFASIYVGVYFDESYNFIGAIQGSTMSGTYNHTFTTPPNAKYVKVNISKDGDLIQSLMLKGYGNLVKPKSAWLNKTIAWYGTSVPAGFPHSGTDAERDVFSYANLAVHDLGGTIINKCVPAGGVGTGVSLSFVRTSDAINYQNSLINLIGTANEPDLVVFDYGVNDYEQHPSDIDAFDPNDPFDVGNTGTKTKIDTRATDTFIGAYNTIIDAMLTAKPDIKFCFITHFSLDNANPSIAVKKDNWKKVIQSQQALADYWSAPIFNLHEKTGYRNRNGFDSITPVMPDYIHPASGDGTSVESLRSIVRDFLISIG